LFASLLAAELLLRLRPIELSNAHLLAAGYALDDASIYVKPEFVDPAYYARNPKLPNVVALGDSFTWRRVLEPRQRYPQRMQRIVRRKGAPMNVINLGMGDSGPDQQLRWFVKWALANVRPDVVVWQFYMNDLWDNASKAVFDVADGRLRPLSAKSNWLYHRQRLFDLTPLPVWLKLNSELYQRVLKTTEREILAPLPARYAGDWDTWALEKIEVEAAEMERLAREHRFAAYFVIVPPQATYFPDEHPPSCIDTAKVLERDAKLRSALRSLPGYIDFELGRAGATTVNDRFYARQDRDTNCLGDRHLNPRGFRAMARVIATHLLAARDNATRPVVSFR